MRGEFNAARVFIGSSTEGLGVAQAVRSLLASDAKVTMWNEGFFRQGIGFLETLVSSLNKFDFAIIIATADDLTLVRGDFRFSPRDNILFELGLFMGHLGRHRTFLIHPRGEDVNLPSDFLGVTTSYESPSSSGATDDSYSSLRQNMSALGHACDQIRDTFHEWRIQSQKDTLTAPGLIRCYTNATDAQAAIGRAITAAREDILLVATNLSYTPVLNVVELQNKIATGVNIHFMVLNPDSQYTLLIARDFLIPLSQLNDENRLHLRTLVDLQIFAESLARISPTAGTVRIHLCDTPLRMRAYIFDGLDGESFFVPYAIRAKSRPLPVYHCQNNMNIAKRYSEGIKNLWDADDTVSIQAFLEKNLDFL